MLVTILKKLLMKANSVLFRSFLRIIAPYMVSANHEQVRILTFFSFKVNKTEHEQIINGC